MRTLASVLFPVLVNVLLVIGDDAPLDIGGYYSRVTKSKCRSGSWSCQNANTCCQSEGCIYQQVSMITSPTADGTVSMTVSGSDKSCYTGSMGPWALSVDNCGEFRL